MAVKHKTGLDYFPFDIDFFGDEKLEFVSARFGLKGEIIAVKLLCKIYRNGYYTEWTEDDAIIFAKRVGDNITAALVNDVVEELAKRDFFDKDIFSRFKVLTSKGIQSRYFEAVERRKGVDVLSHLLLINLEKFDNVSIITQNVNIQPGNVDNDEQSKVEKSKGDKSKLIRANALGDGAGRNLKNEYEKNIVPNLAGKSITEAWVLVKNFIVENKPDFIEPYAQLWNLFVASPKMKSYELSDLKDISDGRRKKFKTRLGEHSFDFIKILSKIQSNANLKGDNKTRWRVKFDYIIENDTNYLKILEETD